MQVLDRTASSIGRYHGVPADVPASAGQVTVSADLPNSEVADGTNWLRLAIAASWDGLNYKTVKLSPVWHGGPGQAKPALTWTWNPADPPARVHGVLDNGVADLGSGVDCGLKLTFAPATTAPEVKPRHWWTMGTLQMALDTWMAQQDRSGTDWSPTFVVPPGKAGLDVEIVAPDWLAPFQTASFAVEVSFNGANGPFVTNGEVTGPGGVVRDKQGNPANRLFGCNFNANAYPTHARIRHEIAGTINCGLNAAFRDPGA